MWHVVDYRNGKAIARGLGSALEQHLQHTELHFVIRDGVCIGACGDAQTIAAPETMLDALTSCPITLIGVQHLHPVAPFVGASVTRDGVAQVRVWLDYESFRPTSNYLKMIRIMAQQFAGFLFAHYDAVLAFELPVELVAHGHQSMSVVNGATRLNRV